MSADFRQNNTKKPVLMIVFGLPGTGKTTFARALAAHLGLPHFNTDIIRAKLGKKQQYTLSDKSFIYARMLERSAEALQKRGGVVLDGTFHRQIFRDPFTELGKEFGIPVIWIELTAATDVVRQRVSVARPFSEADFEVYKKIRKEFEPLKGDVLRLHSDTQALPEMIENTLEYLEK